MHEKSCVSAFGTDSIIKLYWFLNTNTCSLEIYIMVLDLNKTDCYWKKHVCIVSECNNVDKDVGAHFFCINLQQYTQPWHLFQLLTTQSSRKLYVLTQGNMGEWVWCCHDI